MPKALCTAVFQLLLCVNCVACIWQLSEPLCYFLADLIGKMKPNAQVGASGLDAAEVVDAESMIDNILFDDCIMWCRMYNPTDPMANEPTTAEMNNTLEVFG